MADDVKHFVSNRFGSKNLSDRAPASTPVPPIRGSEQSEFDQSIDLRNIYPYSCSPVYHHDRVHYLDRDSNDYFQKLLNNNHGHYSEMIHDQVIRYASANVPPPEEGEQDKTIQAPIVIPAGYSQNRQESRLNFATDVEIEMPSGTLLMARSVDISASGIQLKLNHLVDLINDMEVKLGFPQLEEQQDTSFGQMTYVLKKHRLGPQHMSLFLVRKSPGSKPFDEFIESFIRSKKHRYRIDAEDSSLALISKAWEYLYIKALPYLACFVSTDKERIQVQEICISGANSHQLNGLGQTMLSHLEGHFSTFRIHGIASKEKLCPEIYAFRHRGEGLRRRLCAISWEFSDSAEKLNFLRSAIQQPSFTAWRVEVVNLIDLPASRSRELLSRLNQESEVQANNLVAELNQYDYLLYLVDITDQLKREPLLREQEDTTAPPEHFFDKFEVGHLKNTDYTRLRLGIGKRRNEQRYIYSTPVAMKLYGDKLKGETIDFSVNGLKVNCKQANRFQIRDTVYVEFTGFNKKFRSAKLKSEPYRVVAITPDGAVCLSRDHRVPQHKAASFLKRLIDQNGEILKSCTGELWMSTKARLIEAWMHQCLPTQSLLVGRRKNQYHVPYIIHSHTSDEMLAPFRLGENLYDFSKLFERKELLSHFRHLNIKLEHIINLEIYVSKVGPTANDISIKFWSDFDSDLARAEYLRNQIAARNFMAYNISLSKIPKLDKAELKEDINIIRKNARHRLMEFEEIYHSLVGIAELSDITDQVMSRYNLEQHQK